MKEFLEATKTKGFNPEALTFGETLELAEELGTAVSDIVLSEAQYKSGQEVDDLLDSVERAFQHNLHALEIGLTTGSSFLFGHCARELFEDNFSKKLFNDHIINKAIVYTLAAQVGNHSVGLEPCAGTGDSCPYTGLFRMMLEETEKKKALRAAAVVLKVGTLFRAGKTTTGCNMEGFGAGSAAVAAALIEFWGGEPKQMGKAVVLALSPTIAVPCTPRVMVAGLCATHIGTAILNGALAAKLALLTGIPVNVPVDVMIALAKAVHPISAKYVVPTVIDYLKPFFKTNPKVEYYLDPEIKDKEIAAISEKVADVVGEARQLAIQANLITKPFGEAVVGGSSQAVGSPTNAARIAHELASGEVQGVKIELYPELFARRGINVPGILMGAVFGSSTADSQMYSEIMGKVLAREIAVKILEINDNQLQRITIETNGTSSMVDSLNRGGGRLAIRDARPSREAAIIAAKKLGIDVVG